MSLLSHLLRWTLATIGRDLYSLGTPGTLPTKEGTWEGTGTWSDYLWILMTKKWGAIRGKKLHGNREIVVEWTVGVAGELGQLTEGPNVPNPRSCWIGRTGNSFLLNQAGDTKPVDFEPVPCRTRFVNLAPKYWYQIILVNFSLVLIRTINYLLYFLKPLLLPVSRTSYQFCRKLVIHTGSWTGVCKVSRLCHWY